MRHTAVTTAELVHVPIESIVVGQRRREKLGRLKALAQSIEEHGLIHPVLLRGDTLVAGHRRLEACRSLNWRTIPARQVQRMTEDELRAIELDENTSRENLSDYATSKGRLAQIRATEADLKAKAKAEELSDAVSEKSGRRARGRPKATEPTKEQIAEAAGTDTTTVRRVERHVEVAERYPFMQRPGWLRHHVLDAGDALDRLPEAERVAIGALLDQDAIPAADAIQCLTNAADMPAPQRVEIIQLAGSADEFDRRRALTALAKVPPPPDPGLLALHDASKALTRSASDCRSERFRPQIAALSTEAAALLKEFSTDEREARAHGAI